MNEKTPLILCGSGTGGVVGEQTATLDLTSLSHRDAGPRDAQRNFPRDSHRLAPPTGVCDTSERGQESSGERGMVSDTVSFFKMSTRQKWLLLLLAVSNSVTAACFAVQAPIFPAEAKRKAMPPYLVGLVFGCFELCIVVASPIFGSYSLTIIGEYKTCVRTANVYAHRYLRPYNSFITQVHRLGVRRLFVGGQFTAGTCTILFGALYLSPPGAPFTALCFLLRTLEGLGAAATGVSSLIIVAYEFPASVSMVYGLVETFFGIGSMLSPVIGGALYEVGGYLLPFLVTGALLVLCSVSSLIGMPSTFDIIQQEGKRPSMLQLLRSPIIVVCCVTILNAEMSYHLLTPTLATHLEQFNISAVCVGLVFMGSVGCYGVAAPLIGWFNDKKNFTFSLMIGGHTLLLISLLIVGPAPFLPFLKTSPISIAIAMTMVGIAMALLLIPALKCYYIGTRRLGFKDGLVVDGLVSGLVNASIHIGMFLGPSLSNAVEDATSFPWLCTCGAAVTLFSVLVLTVYFIAEKTCLKYDDYCVIEGDRTDSERQDEDVAQLEER